ncbi:er to golgi transport-related protein [Nannochloropsis gaditana]|uniref:Er to golgi transport-related protein n=1 Tax=Nannochloropsis gaditana TaxID=72520 RepID=W7TR55_9STRA|nr:er to golgi transport-related protein [Nannochloropsis gaditana]
MVIGPNSPDENVTSPSASETSKSYTAESYIASNANLMPQSTALATFKDIEAKVGWNPSLLASPYSQTVRYLQVTDQDARPAPAKGIWVDVVGRNNRAVRRNIGLLRFLGPVHFSKGTWAGIEVQGAIVADNANDGSVDGVRYFSCLSGHQGLLVDVKWVRKSFLQKAPHIAELRGRPPRAFSSANAASLATSRTVLLTAHRLPAITGHNQLPTLYKKLEDFLGLDSKMLPSDALKSPQGVIRDLTYATTRAEKRRLMKLLQEKEEEEIRKRRIQEQREAAARPLLELAEKARQALLASLPHKRHLVHRGKRGTAPPPLDSTRRALSTPLPKTDASRRPKIGSSTTVWPSHHLLLTTMSPETSLYINVLSISYPQTPLPLPVPEMSLRLPTLTSRDEDRIESLESRAQSHDHGSSPTNDPQSVLRTNLGTSTAYTHENDGGSTGCREDMDAVNLIDECMKLVDESSSTKFAQSLPHFLQNVKLYFEAMAVSDEKGLRARGGVTW